MYIYIYMCIYIHTYTYILYMHTHRPAFLMHCAHISGIDMSCSVQTAKLRRFAPQVHVASIVSWIDYIYIIYV